MNTKQVRIVDLGSGTPTSLPILTLTSADRVYHNPTYLERVVEKLVDYILYADNIRGAGRLYLPWIN